MSLRREPRPPAGADDGDPLLIERLRAEIAASGPIPFARFMEIVLYEPEHGYYRTATARPGHAGDFLTAPEAHPLFGRALARFVASLDTALGRPDELAVVEHGAGGGALAVALLERLRDREPEVAGRVRYRPVEVEPRRLAALHERLADAGLADRLEPPDAEPAGRDDPPLVGLVLANEVLDALPVHRLVRRDGRLREVLTDWRDGRFVDVEGPPSDPDLATRLDAEGVVLAEGQRAEVCLALDGWLASAAGRLARGVLLLIDYGHPADELYDPARRAGGTLATYRGHTVGADPYVAIGRQDLTAHVDVTAVERAAAAAGLQRLAVVRQAAFLAGLGIGDLLVELQDGPTASLPGYLEARSAVMRMLDPAATGGFRVMAFGRGLPAGTTLAGLGERPGEASSG